MSRSPALSAVSGERPAPASASTSDSHDLRVDRRAAAGDGLDRRRELRPLWTRSLSRYARRSEPVVEQLRRQRGVAVGAEHDHAEVRARSRSSAAMRRPSSGMDGGIRMSVTTTSRSCSASAARSSSPSRAHRDEVEVGLGAEQLRSALHGRGSCPRQARRGSPSRERRRARVAARARASRAPAHTPSQEMAPRPAVMRAHPVGPDSRHIVKRAPKSGGSRIESRARTAITCAIGLSLTAFALVITATSSFEHGAVGRRGRAGHHRRRAHRRRGVCPRAAPVSPIRADVLLSWARGGRWRPWPSNDGVPYSTGRVSAWIVEVGFVWVILAFPSGSLTGRWARVLVTALAVLVLVGYMPTALLADHYPTPSPWTECNADCPHNAFQLVDSEPAFVSHGLRDVREALTILIFLGVAGVLASRIRSSTRLTRLMLAPVLAVAVARLLVYVVGIGVRAADPGSPLLASIAWTIALLVPAMAVAFLIGLLRWELFSARALERLAVRLLEHPDARQLRNALAGALGDPWLDLAFWRGGSGGGWVDARGRPVDLTPGAGPSVGDHHP